MVSDTIILIYAAYTSTTFNLIFKCFSGNGILHFTSHFCVNMYFEKRVKRAYKKYRQVSDYVGRFKQAKKMHQDDVALYTKQFKEQTEKAET